ncbi:hypothetical protein CJ030_MR7G011524 [Morella rubra]|uniref:Uncharacterized protein n=1 Tax=Morella rubra TaxID=262757 RepID=A0A6A1V3I4_9ROSI|nr:hypothetical protein CJ030_MR7G011520 [Morella rubra]KAB1207203.1 hypothetical protein CJ030_MR7G011524 [Morella rubra]
MSGQVDIWTKLGTLREKGQPLFSNASSASNGESSQTVQPKEGRQQRGLVQAFSRYMRVNAPVLLYTEGSVSMMVECCSA